MHSISVRLNIFSKYYVVIEITGKKDSLDSASQPVEFFINFLFSLSTFYCAILL